MTELERLACRAVGLSYDRIVPGTVHVGNSSFLARTKSGYVIAISVPKERIVPPPR